MPTVDELFPSKWLKAEDLKGRTARVHVEKVQIEKIRNPRTNQEEQRIIVSFHGKEKKLILNKTQAFALASATGEREIMRWPGHEITLSPSIAPNKQPTIQIGKPEAKPAPAAPSAQAQDEDEDDEHIDMDPVTPGDYQ